MTPTGSTDPRFEPTERTATRTVMITAIRRSRGGGERMARRRGRRVAASEEVGSEERRRQACGTNRVVQVASMPRGARRDSARRYGVVESVAEERVHQTTQRYANRERTAAQ